MDFKTGLRQQLVGMQTAFVVPCQRDDKKFLYPVSVPILQQPRLHLLRRSD